MLSIWFGCHDTKTVFTSMKSVPITRSIAVPLCFQHFLRSSRCSLLLRWHCSRRCRRFLLSLLLLLLLRSGRRRLLSRAVLQRAHRLIATPFSYSARNKLAISVIMRNKWYNYRLCCCAALWLWLPPAAQDAHASVAPAVLSACLRAAFARFPLLRAGIPSMLSSICCASYRTGDS
jgi:hypothetical protein